MKIIEAEHVTRYRVDFTDTELVELVATGAIHESVLKAGSGRGRLWISCSELNILAMSPALSNEFKTEIRAAHLKAHVNEVGLDERLVAELARVKG